MSSTLKVVQRRGQGIGNNSNPIKPLNSDDLNNAVEIAMKPNAPITFDGLMSDLDIERHKETKELQYNYNTMLYPNNIANRKNFLRKNIPDVDKAVIETRELQKNNMLSTDTKQKIKDQINIVNKGMKLIWPKIGDKSKLVPEISTTKSLLGGKRTRRARIGSNKTKHRRRNQYKR